MVVTTAEKGKAINRRWKETVVLKILFDYFMNTKKLQCITMDGN